MTEANRRERRGSERLQVQAAATCRVPASPHKVTVLDVSYDGCRLAFERTAVSIGSTVNLVLGRSRVAGQVVWTSGIEVGIRFDRPLPSEAAVVVGLEEAAAQAPVEVFVAEAAPSAGLRHWIRRVLGLSPSAA